MDKTNSNVATLHAKDGTRRDKALAEATYQLEAILNTLVLLVRQERGEIPEWPNFDSEWLPDIIRALAIRGRNLNDAVMIADHDEISTDDLEKRVFVGLR